MNRDLRISETGELVLEKTDQDFRSLKLLFEIVLQSEQLHITNIQEASSGDRIVLNGTTMDWGNEESHIELVFEKPASENAAPILKQLAFKKNLAEFDELSLPNVDLGFEGLTNALFVSLPEPGPSSGLAYMSRETSGSIRLGTSTLIPFRIQNAASSRAYEIESTFAAGEGPGLTELAALFGNHADPENDLVWLPENLRDVTLLTLRDLVLKIDPNHDSKLTSIRTTVNILPGHRWPIIPGLSFLTIGKLWFTLEVDYPLDPEYRLPNFTIGGSIQIGDAGSQPGQINLTARWPDWAIAGELERGNPIRLGQLLEQLTLPANQLPQDENALLVNQLLFTAEPATTPREFSFLITIDNVWKLQLSQDTVFSIDELSLSLDYREQPTGSRENGVNGQFIGKASLSGIDITVLAAYGGANAGWNFSGETGKDQPIALGHLIAEGLRPIFGSFTAPAPISSLTLQNLATSFNTASKDFSFSGETALALALAEGSQERVDFTLNIDLKKQGNGRYSKQFSGLLALRQLFFEVHFDLERQVTAVGEQSQPNDSRTFLAVYQDRSGQPVEVDDLLSLLGITVQTGLSFTVKEALLGYRKTNDSAAPAANIPSVADGKWLFGIDIEGGLNLSAIHFDDLPFVSIPPDQTLTLDFQVLIASQGLIQSEIEAMSALAPNSSLAFPAIPPEGIVDPSQTGNRVDLSVTLDFGSGSKQIDLPIGLQTGPSSTGNGLVPDTQANASTPLNGSGVATTGQHGVRWITLQKQLGPLAFERIGVFYETEHISAFLDASLASGELTIALNGLSVRSRLNHFEPTFSLEGLGIDFKNASVEIGGTFLKEENGFAGLAVIKTEALSLAAIGAYAYADGEPSLFIYAVLDYPLGGPAFFYVTGVAAGFGYNRRLVMPSIEQVAAFPLVQEATGQGTTQGGAGTPLPEGQEARANRLQSTIRSLSQSIPIASGNYFLVAGLRFTSFKQIDSFALLAVQFGNRFEVDLLGLSTLMVPAPAEGESIPAVAEAQLALKAAFVPAEGFLGVRAQLTSNSYILSRSCRLTGGFAFFSWFSEEHEGDFVLSLGGYHPAFEIPSHYPTVPRLGFAWQVSDDFHLSGELYFALAAHALMAGGLLEAVYQTDSVKAWFQAGADFLIAWKPYHYEVSIFVNLDLDITVRHFGVHQFSLSAAADLKLWGPEFGGEAHIKVKVLSLKIPIDIAFGQQSPTIPALSLAEFQQSFLPVADQVCSVAIQAGLIETINDNGEEIWIVSASEMVLVTNSVIPSDGAVLFGQDQAWDGGSVAVQPMGVRSDEITSTHTVSLPDMAIDDRATLTVTPIAKKMPAALWGQPELAENDSLRHDSKHRYVEKPQLNGERFVEDTLAGYEIRGGKRPPPGATHAIPQANLRTELETVDTLPAWPSFVLEDALGMDAWHAAAGSNRLVHNETRNEILAVLGLGQLDIDFGEPLTDHVALSGALGSR